VPAPKSDCQCNGGNGDNGASGDKPDPQVEAMVGMITGQILAQLGAK
jgi:hypothetical protein